MLNLNTAATFHRVTSTILLVYLLILLITNFPSVSRVVDDEIEANIEEVFLPELSNSTHSDGHTECNRAKTLQGLGTPWAEHSLKARLQPVSLSLIKAQFFHVQGQGG